MSMNKHYYYGKAASLIKGVENYIGFDKDSGLIKDGSPEGVFLDTFENSSLAIAYVLLGRKEDAKRIFEGIKTHIGIDPETGLFYNKKGLSKDESKKTLPGEKTLYLSNQVLVSILCEMLGMEEEARELEKKYEKEIGTFEFEVNGKKYQIYRHAKNKNYFYPFNNLLVAINKISLGQEDKAEKLVADIKEICFDDKVKLLRANPKDRIYFTLNNALLSTYQAITGREKESANLIHHIEEKIGFDEKTGLAFEGFTPRGKIKNILTYVNTQLAISYLALAGIR